MDEVDSRAPDSEAALRAAVHEAIVDLVVERGYRETSVEMIAERAGISGEEFECLYADKEECYLAAYKQETDRFIAAAAGAFVAEDNWRDGLRATAYAAARWVRDHPREIRFGTLDILDAGEMAQTYRVKTLSNFVDLLDAGRAELSDPDSLSRSTAEASAGAISELLVRRLQAGGGTTDAVDLVPELMYLAVRPYVGQEEALKELTLPPPPEPAEVPGQTRTQTDPAVPESDGERYPAAVAADEGDGEQGGGLSRLPQGRHGLPRDLVVQNQLDRLVSGMIATVAKLGYRDTTVALVCQAAGVSRRTFYEHYSDKKDCFFATYAVIAEHLLSSTRAAAASYEDWPHQVRAQIAAALEIFAANPDLARFYLGAPQRAGNEIAERYRLSTTRILAELTSNLPADVRRPPAAVQNAALGGIASVVVGKVEAGEGRALPDLLPDLTEVFLAPFIGREQAAAVARGD